MIWNVRKSLLSSVALTAIAFALGSGAVLAQHEHTSGMFQGAKVNGGTVTHTKQGQSNVLTLSDDFQVPDTPAPHWQVVDSHGNTYLLQRLTIKGDKVNRSIVVPSYVMDIASVQIWCAYAEALLGEASFQKPVR